MKKSIITVVGKDTVGIIARVCAYLADNNINILDITQTIMQGNFTMIMAVDLGKATVSVTELAGALEELGKKMQITIRVQRDDIFNAMNRI